MGDEENTLVDMAWKEEQRHRATAGEGAGDCCGLESVSGGRLEGSSRPTDSVKPSFLMES